ncbi:hypothetical protein AB4212_21555, partial [Streptomyces sp. 2MCAF27]
MSSSEEIRRIYTDSRLSGPRKRDRIFAYLYALEEHGVPVAVEALIAADKRHLAGYLAQYLGLTPGYAEQKTRAAEALREHE